MKKNIIIWILVVLLLILSGFICYDKLIRNDNDSKKDMNCPKVDCQCKQCENNLLGEKVTSIKEFAITDKNQTVKIGKNEIKLRKEDDYLLVDDNYVYAPNSSYKLVVMEVFLTDKYIFFTNIGQDGHVIVYAIGENGKIGINNDDYQMNNFRIEDGYLYAEGHVFCGLDEECSDKKLIIKYIDNTLIVTDNN